MYIIHANPQGVSALPGAGEDRFTAAGLFGSKAPADGALLYVAIADACMCMPHMGFRSNPGQRACCPIFSPLPPSCCKFVNGSCSNVPSSPHLAPTPQQARPPPRPLARPPSRCPCPTVAAPLCRPRSRSRCPPRPTPPRPSPSRRRGRAPSRRPPRRSLTRRRPLLRRWVWGGFCACTHTAIQLRTFTRVDACSPDWPGCAEISRVAGLLALTFAAWRPATNLTS